jgi:HlyD family secretion protein
MKTKINTERTKKKNKTKRIVIIGVVVLFVFLIVARRMGVIGGDEQVKVATEKVELIDIIEFVSASGKIQPNVEVKISPDVSGEVIEIFVREGDAVKQGDRLARIKPDTYQSNYEQIKASYDGQKANLANTKARLSQSKAQFYNAEATYNRSKSLYEQGLVSKADYENVKASYEVARAEIEAGEQTVSAAEFGVKSAEATLNEARNNLTRTTIFAPIDGTVYQISVEAGERVAGASQFSAGTEIMRIADLNEMEVQVSINENDIIRIDYGDSVDIEVDAYFQKKFKGVVTRISNSTAGSQLISSTDQVTNYDVRIRILPESYSDLIDENKVYKYPFRPGMSASVDIITNRVVNVLSVPIQSVTTREDTATKDNNLRTEKAELTEVVFVYKSGTVEMRKVATGIQDSYYIEVISGLQQDEEIVVSPYSAISRRLKDKDPVKKVDKSKLFEN